MAASSTAAAPVTSGAGSRWVVQVFLKRSLFSEHRNDGQEKSETKRKRNILLFFAVQIRTHARLQ